MNTRKSLGKCNFYFTIPAANSTPPVQFAYYPQLPLEISQNYTNISIPWVKQIPQFFTYSMPNSAGNDIYMVTISNLNIAVVQSLFFSSNDTYYQSLYCYSTFPSESSSIEQCNISQIYYSEGNMDYQKFVFQLKAGSQAVLGFLTNQNGTHNTFDFSSNYSIYHSCDNGFFYNVTSLQCVNCSSYLDYCLTCENSQTCIKCLNPQLQIVSGKCSFNCPTGNYQNPNITSSSDVCLQCMDNCISCNNNSTCNECNPQFLWDATSQSCQPKITSCPSGYYYNSVNASCIKCDRAMQGCEICSSNATCTQCNSKLTLTSGQCQCPQGQYQNPEQMSSIVCLSCINHCEVCIDASTCIQCFSPYVWDTTSQSCNSSSIVCSSGSFYDSMSATCVQCSSVLQNCAICSNSSSCTACINTGLIIVDGKCIVNCPAGQYYNFPTDICLECDKSIRGCQTCSSSTLCTSCSSGLTLTERICYCSEGQYQNPDTTSSALCLSCMNHCLTCSNATYCTQCSSSYTWNVTSLSCSTSSSVCSPDSFYNSTSATCVQCSSVLKNCEKCSNSSSCTACINTGLIIVDGKFAIFYYNFKRCIANCQAGYYQNPNIIVSSSVCLPCMNYCKSCNNNITCNECDQQYFYNSTTVSCEQNSTQPVIYNWNLTGLSTYWQNEQECYWSFQLNYSLNTANVYELKLTTDEITQQTPGTIYIFYNIDSSLHNVYVSTNCSTVEACNNYTTAPSQENYCWVAGSSSIWSMNTQTTEGQCYFYFQIPELTEIPQIQFAFLPQLKLSQAKNYTDLPVPWAFQTEQFFTYQFAENYLYKNAQNGVHKLTFSGMNSQIVSKMYVATNDPRYNSRCSTNFPGQSLNCGTTSSSYSVDNTTYLSYTFSLDQAASHIVLGFMTNLQDSINYFDFNSNSAFQCYENYILNNNTCVKEQTQDLTNSSTIHSSGSTNKSYWNVSIDPSSSQEEEEKVFNVEIEPINFPGTFYLSSQLLSTVYISTNCNSSKPCNSFTESPQAEQYCFTQESGQNGIFVNSYQQDSSESCQFDFVFPNADNTNGLVQMQYFPIEEITDTSSYQIYIPSSSSTLPRYIKYKLPSQTTIPEKFDHFLVKISNIPYQLLDNIYYSTNDQTNALNDCFFTQFPDNNSGCSYKRVSQSESIVAIEFNVTSTSSENYIAFYTKQSNDELYLNLIVSSSIECKEGYYYSSESVKCVQTVSCSEGYYYDKQKLECIECSSNLPYCVECSSTGEYCTKCVSGENGKITLTDGQCLISCQSGKYPNPTKSFSNQCLSCMDNCIQCTSATTCEECYEPTYKLVDSKCENTCKTGEYFDIDQEQCVSCQVQYCSVCYGSGNQCTKCTDGYEPVQSVSDEYVCQKIETRPKSGEKVKLSMLALFILLICFFIEI